MLKNIFYPDGLINIKSLLLEMSMLFLFTIIVQYIRSNVSYLPDVPLRKTLNFKVYCIDGVTQVKNVVFIGDGHSEICEQCILPVDHALDAVFYSYEFDCYPVCETDVLSTASSSSMYNFWHG